MAKNEVISVFCFNEEIGRLGLDENLNKSTFQYNQHFLNSNKYNEIFPETGIIKRTNQTQIFSQFNSETFRGIPPMIADSLPDLFGNIIFNKWLEANNKNLTQITVLEQLAYVANRGMGALEYKPSKNLPLNANINLTEIIQVLKNVLELKQNTSESNLSHKALLNIFKIGTSAGGARPKILISENKITKEIIAGDLNYSSDFEHFIVKLSLGDELGYEREIIEYIYYLTAINLGINMMPSKLVDNKHFATVRFDRQNGAKKHILTASGLTGWDFQKPENSSYENLFELTLFLKIPHAEIEQLFRRMIFNIVFCNTDDHLKNHTFIYNEIENNWNLSPAYDLTYSLNPLLNYTKISRALSINNKRININLDDVLTIANRYTIKNPKNIITEIQNGINFWNEKAEQLNILSIISQKINKGFKKLI